MNDMSAAIVPKSDQLNADDLIAGPITIRITGVNIKSGEQPVSIFYEGDNGKPYKCCKSMARILVAAWGADSKKYAGRSLTLYRDPAVKWAGMEVGGIRISHMSDIDEAMTMALTATKGSRKPFTVRPLIAEVERSEDTEESLMKEISAAASESEVQELANRCMALDDPEARKRLIKAGKERLKILRTADAQTDAEAL